MMVELTVRSSPRIAFRKQPVSSEGGFIVTAAPEILFLKDTNQDHRADLKEVLFDGFIDNNSEAQITNLRFSPDNWIYAAQFGQRG